MDLARCFSPDYATARMRFLAAASAAGVPVESFYIGERGPSGEDLAIDSARLGPPRAERLLVLSSGLHGIEGYFGAAVQLAWLASLADGPALPLATAVLLVHAVNPYGFAWGRRWNGHNVDLNRNFVADRSFLADDPVYAECRRIYGELAVLLNPDTPPSALEPWALKAAARIFAHGRAMGLKRPMGSRPSIFALRSVFRLGLAGLEQALTVGQYDTPDALFYGGAAMEAEAVHMADLVCRHAAGAEQVVHLDFHTGLGAAGDVQLQMVDDIGSAEERWAIGHFGAARVKAKDKLTPFRERGLMMSHLAERLGPERYHCLAAEFGTHPPLRVLGALRAERRAHLHCAPGSPGHVATKRELKEAFCPTSPAWRQTTVRKALEIIEQAMLACSG